MIWKGKFDHQTLSNSCFEFPFDYTCNFLVPIAIISVPIQKRMAQAWMLTAAKSFHTSELFDCKPAMQQKNYVKVVGEILEEISNLLRRV